MSQTPPHRLAELALQRTSPARPIVDYVEPEKVSPAPIHWENLISINLAPDVHYRDAKSETSLSERRPAKDSIAFAVGVYEALKHANAV